jgi:hypothetical protein
VIGFKGLGSYPHLLATLVSSEQAASESPLALLLNLGVGPVTAKIFVSILGAGFLVAAAVVAYRRRPFSDARVLTLCLVAALVASPIVWPHYLLLLLVPVAIAHPRLSLPWLIALVSWISPRGHGYGPFFTALSLSVAAATLIATYWIRSDDAAASAEVPASA